MYENYTYEQVKNLPDEQKIEALKELKVIYPENKILAQHWDVAHIAVSNMVGKYLEGKQMGRKKMTEEEKAQKKAERETNKKLKQYQEHQRELQEQEEVKTNVKEIKDVEEINNAQYDKDITQTIVKETKYGFSIKLDIKMTGEEAINRLSGIANSLLKENEYKVELNVEEV